MMGQEVSYSHKVFQRALNNALKLYLYLLDFPEDIDGLGHLSAADRKKERAKLKKKKTTESDKVQIKDGNNDAKEKVSDPNGELLLQKDFLSEAYTWCQHLLSWSAPPQHGSVELGDLLTKCSAENIALIVDVLIRRNRYLPAIRALNIGFQRFPHSSELILVVTKIASKLKAKKLTGMNATVQPIFRQEISRLLGNTNSIDLTNFLDNYLTGYVIGNELKLGVLSVKHTLAAVKMTHALEKTTASTKIREILSREYLERLFTNAYGINYENISELIQVSFYLFIVIVVSQFD
jgi:hypothetical protein